MLLSTPDLVAAVLQRGEDVLRVGVRVGVRRPEVQVAAEGAQVPRAVDVDALVEEQLRRGRRC